MSNRRNERKGNKTRQAAARRKLAEAKARLALLVSVPSRNREVAKEIDDVKAQIAHWRAKSVEESETHSRRHKGNR